MMRQPSIQRRRVALLIVLPALIALACGSGGGSSPNSQPGELVIEQDIVFGPGELILTDVRSGLANLSSYQSEVLIKFEGTRDGQPEQWSDYYLMLATQSPYARQWTINATGAPSDPESIFAAELQQTDYQWSAGQACTATPAEAGALFGERLDPAAFLTGVIGAEEAGTDRVNDVDANHYTFDQRALGEEGVSESTGELWLAVDGGYIVRYLLTTTAGEDYFGEGVEGTLNVSYEVKAANQPMTIQLPGDCPGGMVEAPQLPDAGNAVNMDGLLGYETAAGIDEVIAFYKEQLPALGWTLNGEPRIEEDTAIMEFRREGEMLTVTALSEEAGTRVQIWQGPAPQ